MCGGCFIITPWLTTIEFAEKRWNTRPTPAAPVAKESLITVRREDLELVLEDYDDMQATREPYQAHKRLLAQLQAERDGGGVK